MTIMPSTPWLLARHFPRSRVCGIPTRLRRFSGPILLSSFKEQSMSALPGWQQLSKGPRVRNANNRSVWKATTAIHRTALPFPSSLDHAGTLVKAHRSAAGRSVEAPRGTNLRSFGSRSTASGRRNNVSREQTRTNRRYRSLLGTQLDRILNHVPARHFRFSQSDRGMIGTFPIE
jgi:hypothetical protein